MDADVIGISGRRLHAFLEDRLDGRGPCRVQEDLKFSLLAGSSVVPNARLFMAALDGGGTKLTPKANLNRKFVEMLLDRLQWHDCGAAEIRAVCKTINEHDFAPAIYLHAVSRLVGIVRSENGLLKLTKKGFALLRKKRQDCCRRSYSAPHSAGIIWLILMGSTYATFSRHKFCSFSI